MSAIVAEMLKSSKLEAEIAALKAENASLKAQLHLSTSGGLGNAKVNASDYNNPRTSQAGDSEEAQSLLLKIREESTNSKASIGSIIVNATYRPLSTLPAEIQGIESGMNANQAAKRAKMRLIKLECFLTWPSLIVYEHVNPSDVLEIPYSDVGDDIWATTTVLSWRWDESKPWTHAEFIAMEDFTPMSRDQFTELQTMIRAMPSSISYIWVDWSCVPQYLSDPMVEIFRSKVYYARSCIMLVLPTFGPLPQKSVLCNLLGQVKVVLSRRSSHKAIVASKVISAIENKNRLASHEYFTRIWTLAERMARFGRDERLCNWLSLESWLGMLLDALFRRTANVYSKILGPASRRLINAATSLIQDAVNTDTIQDPKLIERVADLLELAVTSWLPSSLPSVVEAPTTDWLRVYLGKESVSGLYNAFKQEDRVWAIYTYFIWGEETDIRRALEALVRLVDDDVETEEEVRNEGMFLQLGLTNDKEGWSPLHRATMKGKTETVRSLLSSLSAEKEELDKRDKNGHTPLHLACGQGYVEVAALLLDAGANKEAQGDEDGYFPLMVSCSGGKVEVFKLLIERGANVNSKSGTNGATALIRAADFGHEAIVQSLLANGAKAYIRGRDGKMAFDVAKSQSLQAVLNKALGSTREEREARKLELVEKISQGMLDDAESLITKGYDVNAKDKDERSPLLVACDKGYEAIAKSLIESGANANAKDKFGYTPFDWACVRGHRCLIKLLHLVMTNHKTLDNDVKVDAVIVSTLIKIVEAAKSKYGDRPLVTAARAVDEWAVKSLISSGYKDLEERDKDGRTPLLNTAAFGMESSLMALLAAGANINAQSNWGRTALIIAADLGQVACVRLLLEAGADRSIADTTNKTALAYASTEEIKNILQE